MDRVDAKTAFITGGARGIGPKYDTYQAGTKRDIPVVLLTPRCRAEVPT